MRFARLLDEIEDIVIERHQQLRIESAQLKMRDVPWRFASGRGLAIDAVAVLDVAMRKIEDVPCRIVHAHAGKGTVARPAQILDARKFRRASQHGVDAFHLETEMIEPSLATGRP